MISPSSVISAGSFFCGLILEYSSFGVPGATDAEKNSILSIRPSSIAAIRTLRAKGEAGVKASFISGILECDANGKIVRQCEPSGRRQTPPRLLISRSHLVDVWAG